jgi:transposase
VSSSAALVLREGDRDRLGDLAQPSAALSEVARRARIVLLAADGMPNAQIARTLGVSRPTVIVWRGRYEQGGIQGLQDGPRSGRPREIDELDVVVATLARGGRPPAGLGISYWSVRSLAAELGISFASVARIWRKWGIQPQQIGTFTFGTEPELEFKIGDVAALYLDSPSDVIVVSAGQPGRAGPTATAEVVAALQNAIDQASSAAHVRAVERPDLLEFLKKAAASRPWTPLRVIIGDGEAALPSVLRAWLRENPLITVHTATNGCGWLDLVGILFGVLSNADDLHGCDPSVKDLIAAVRRFANAYDDRSGPFTWIND